MYSRGRLRGHAAADVPGRRPQAAGHLHAARRAARRAAGRARRRSRSSTSGGRAPTSLDAQWIADAAMRVDETVAPTLTAGLPAAPRLRPAALRRRRPAHRRRTSARSTRLRRADRALRERAARASSCCPSTASPTCRRPVHINRALREAGCSPCATSWAASCSTPAPARPSRRRPPGRARLRERPDARRAT